MSLHARLKRSRVLSGATPAALSTPRKNYSGAFAPDIPVTSESGIVSDPAQVPEDNLITNLLLQSEAIVSGSAPNSPWTINNGGTPDPGAVTCSVVSSQDPNGNTANISRLAIGAISGNGYAQLYQGVATTAVAHRWSVWMRKVSGTGSVASWFVNSGSKVRTALVLTSEWQRFSGTFTGSATTTYFYIGGDGSLGAQGDITLDVWGAMVETDAATGPSTYVPTTTAQASIDTYCSVLFPCRLADVNNWGVGVKMTKADWTGADTLVSIGTGNNSSNLAITAEGTTGSTTSTAVDPIGLPPNSQYPSSPDTSSRSQLLRDLNPAGGGDLLGLAKTRDGATDVYYLLLSTDDGATWSYIAASGGSAPPHDGFFLHDQAICQDTVNYDVHWTTVPQWATSVRYHRIALEYSVDGHVNGWSWEAADQPGPALDTSEGTYQGKAEIQEVIDGSSNHVLLITGIDRPSETRTSRLVAARTAAGATALAPTSASHWLQLDGSAGVSILCAKNSDTGVDPSAMLNLIGIHQDDNIHTMDCCAAQLDNGDLAVFLGPMYFNDPTGVGDIRRWRFTRSGENWALDASTNGAEAISTAPDGYSKPCMGNCVAGDSSAWLVYFDNNGLHVGSVNSSGVWAADGMTQPDTYNGSQAHFIYGWCTIGFGLDGNLCIHYERNGIFGDYATRCRQFEGYWTGSEWSLTETSELWRRSTGYDPDTPGADGSTSWSPIRGAHGAGVFAYPYVDWATGHPHHSIHTLQQTTVAVPGGVVLTVFDSTGASATRTLASHSFLGDSMHSIVFGAVDGVPTMVVDGVETGTLEGTAILSSFQANIGVNDGIAPVAKTVVRLVQGSILDASMEV